MDPTDLTPDSQDCAAADLCAVGAAPQASLDYERLTVSECGKGCGNPADACASATEGPPARGPRPLHVAWGWQDFSWQRMADHAAASVPWRAARARALQDTADFYRGRRRWTAAALRWRLVAWGPAAAHATVAQALAATASWQRKARKRTKKFRNLDGIWHRERAAALEQRVDDKVWNCNGNSVQIVDLSTGEHRRVEVPCNDRTCPACADRRARRASRKIFDNLRQITAGERRSPDGPRHAYLLTFNVRHCGDAATDTQRLQAGWERWRSAWHAWQKDRYRKKHGKGAKHPRPAFAYVRVLEASSGTKKHGHAHLHVLAWLPRWFPWAAAQRWWRKGLRKADASLGVIYDDKLRRSPGNMDIDRGDAKAITGYVSKVSRYVSKFGVDILGCTPEAGAALADSLYGRRWMTTSVGLLAQPLAAEWQTLQKPDPVPRWEHWHLFAPREWSSVDTTAPPQRDNQLW